MAEDIKPIIRAVKAHPLSLVMNDGTIPSKSGVVYKFRSGYTEYREFWLWEVEGYNDEAFYTFSPYPDDSVMDDLKDIYAGEDWFDPDEMDEVLVNGYDVNKVCIYVENTYNLPYQNITLENGRVFAHDEETGKERELIKAHFIVQDNDGNWEELSFFLFTRNTIWTKPMILNLLGVMDSKVPQPVREKANRLYQYILNGNDYEFRAEDVYVLSTI